MRVFFCLISAGKKKVEEVNAGGRGGVQLVTDKRSGYSWLLVTAATWRDAGNYTCAPVHATPATVSVHVLDGKLQWHFYTKTPLQCNFTITGFTPAHFQKEVWPSVQVPRHAFNPICLL